MAVQNSCSEEHMCAPYFWMPQIPIKTCLIVDTSYSLFI